MSIPVLRTDDAWWVRVGDGVVQVDTTATTTAELLADRPAVEAAARRSPSAPMIPDRDLRSPITKPCRVVAQMTNYASHAEDAGMDPTSVPLTFFRKASGSISGPYDDVVRPAGVRLLDYEAEIGLVVGTPMPVGADVTPSTLDRIVAGLVITNDVSARDIQLPKTQFYEGKSYPTFTPAGPVLLLLEENEFVRFADLRLRLLVNGQIRQDCGADDMIYRPLETLRALSGFQRLDPGDVLLTGTPVGTALSAPLKIVEAIGTLLPAATKWRIFFRRQARNPKYLHDGDVIEIEIATDDRGLDLGRQRTRVTSGE